MTTESDRETIAARWLIEQDDPDFSDGQRAELTRWIMQSADNCNTYVRLVRAWRWAVLLHRAEPPIVHRKAAPVGSSSRKSKVDRRFGDVLRAYREDRGLSRAELADLCGMRAGEISDIEAGIQSLTILSLYVLARALEVPASRLISQLEKTISGRKSAPRKRKSP
jgi:ribosome-binding protein aMBF1 (putative translation factor)